MSTKKSNIPANAKPLETNVLRAGEHTGHAHRLVGGNFTIMTTTDERMFLRVGNQPTMVTHEEHRAFDILSGEYEIKAVQEFDHFAEEARAVAD